MSRGKALAGGAVFAVLVLSAGALLSAGPVRAAPPAFVFSGAGDFGSWGGFDESLRQIRATESEFVLALGDLSYNGTSEQNWCDEFHQATPNVVLIAGNHDVGKPQDIGGNINEFIRYCPFPLDVPLTGVYGKQFYFDYPRRDPLVRIILISPGLPFIVDGGEVYDYSRGSPRYIWTREAIDGAREEGIPWVVVGSHENCVAAGEHGCEIGTDLFNLFLERKVDLILQAHNHHYERSKQLALSAACRGIAEGEYNPVCVVNPGSDGRYTKGAGSVLVIAGTGGRDLIDFDEGNPFAGYIAAYAGNHTELGKGVVAFNVSRDRMTMETHFNRTYQDRFTLAAPPVPPSFFETLPRGVPFVAPAVVAAEMLIIGLFVARRPKRRRIEAPAPRPSAGRAPVPAKAMANGGTAVKLQGRRFFLDESGALRLED